MLLIYSVFNNNNCYRTTIDEIASKALEILTCQVAEEDKFSIKKVLKKGYLVIRESV